MTSKSLSTACALAYPLAAHFAVVRGSSAWIGIALALLTGSFILPALLRGSWAAWLFLPLVLAGCWALQRLNSPVLPLYVAPIIGPTFMAGVFGHTLGAGRTSLIEQAVRLIHERAGSPPSDPAVWPYARRLTLIWTALFVAIALTNLILGLIAEPHGILLSHGIRPRLTVTQHTWSLFANLIGYLLVAAFFLIEYAYRRRRFPQQPFRNFYDFLKQMSAAMPQLIKRDV